jgi:hypothetical protein
MTTTEDIKLNQLINNFSDETSALAEKIHELCKGHNRLITKWALVDIIAHEYDHDEIREIAEETRQYRQKLESGNCASTNRQQ